MFKINIFKTKRQMQDRIDDLNVQVMQAKAAERRRLETISEKDKEIGRLERECNTRMAECSRLETANKKLDEQIRNLQQEVNDRKAINAGLISSLNEMKEKDKKNRALIAQLKAGKNYEVKPNKMNKQVEQ